MKVVLALLGALLVAGCNNRELPNVDDPSSMCEALIGPIKYNTQNKASKRFAAAVLALDLKQRNQVGQALHCPQYR